MKTEKDHAAFAAASDLRYQQGLTKREYFAAMAMQGILSDPNVTNLEDAVSSAVAAADALITALNKQP